MFQISATAAEPHVVLTAVDPNTAPRELQAVITSVTGKSVQYSLDEGQPWQPAHKGVKLPRSARIRTGFASSCEVSFRDKTVARIAALSSAQIAEYSGGASSQKVRIKLRYGAVRCGVEKGRFRSDTQISTPVSVLSIRGTIARVEFDMGTDLCEVKELSEGLADFTTRRGSYALRPGMTTDSSLSRHLQNAIFARTVFVTGNVSVGGLTGIEVDTITDLSGAIGLPIDDPTTIKIEQESSDGGGGGGGDCPECDPGPVQ